MDLQHEDAADVLSFATASPREWWKPDTSGDWDKQNARGREHARELISYIQRSGDGAVFSAVMRDMHKDGAEQTGVSVGFLAWISYELLCGASAEKALKLAASL